MPVLRLPLGFVRRTRFEVSRADLDCSRPLKSMPSRKPEAPSLAKVQAVSNNPNRCYERPALRTSDAGHARVPMFDVLRKALGQDPPDARELDPKRFKPRAMDARNLSSKVFSLALVDGERDQPLLARSAACKGKASSTDPERLNKAPNCRQTQHR